MRLALIILLLFTICSCVEHISKDDLDINAIEVAALQLHENSFNTELKGNDIPPALSKLEYISISMDKTGVYIKLDEFFVQESGLFIAIGGFKPDLSEGSDPNFKYLSGNTYSYIIKG